MLNIKYKINIGTVLITRRYARDAAGKENAEVEAIKMKVFVFQPNGIDDFIVTTTYFLSLIFIGYTANAQASLATRPIPILNPFNVAISYSKSLRPNSAIASQSININLQPIELFVSYNVCTLYVFFLS